jgi:hypothetical protein
MVYFQTKNPILGKFWRALEWQIWYILWPFGIYYCRFGNLVVYFSPFWYIGVFFCQEKSGTPGSGCCQARRSEKNSYFFK